MFCTDILIKPVGKFWIQQLSKILMRADASMLLSFREPGCLPERSYISMHAGAYKSTGQVFPEVRTIAQANCGQSNNNTIDGSFMWEISNLSTVLSQETVQFSKQHPFHMLKNIQSTYT